MQMTFWKHEGENKKEREIIHEKYEKQGSSWTYNN